MLSNGLPRDLTPSGGISGRFRGAAREPVHGLCSVGATVAARTAWTHLSGQWAKPAYHPAMPGAKSAATTAAPAM